MTSILTIAVIIVIFIVLYKVFKFIISLVLIGVFLMIAYITNPSIENHKAAVYKKAAKEGISLKHKKVDRENYYLFSLTRLSQEDDEKVIGAGGFTQVIVFRKP
jgi:hypothetical protein